VRSKPKGVPVTPETVDPEIVRPAVVDGLLIARSAASIGVANRIIVRALREDASFDHDETADDVRAELRHLAGEQRDLAERMVTTRTRALKSRGRSRHQFDYRPDDNEALALRETIYTTIADELALLGDDPDYVDAIVLSARDRAWNDIGSAIVDQVRSVVVRDADYAEGREERLRQLLEVDLEALAKAR
jgi:hypothetical protein